MSQDKGSNEKQVTISISDSMSIYEATDIHKKLLNSLAEETTINIDLSEVKSCDVVGIQLLLSVIKTGKVKGKQITISNVSEAIQETSRLIGVPQEILYGFIGG